VPTTWAPRCDVSPTHLVACCQEFPCTLVPSNRQYEHGLQIAPLHRNHDGEVKTWRCQALSRPRATGPPSAPGAVEKAAKSCLPRASQSLEVERGLQPAHVEKVRFVPCSGGDGFDSCASSACGLSSAGSWSGLKNGQPASLMAWVERQRHKHV